jgi:hypothetical protein
MKKKKEKAKMETTKEVDKKRDKRMLFLREFVDFFWKEYNKISEKEKKLALKKFKDVLNENNKSVKDKENRIWLLKELKIVLIEERNLEKELNLSNVESLKEIFINLLKLSTDSMENFYFLDEFKGFLLESKLKSKDEILDYKINNEIYWCLREENKILYEAFKKNKIETYQKIKRNYIELVGFCHNYFNSARNSDEKVLVLKDYLKIIEKIKKEGFYEDLIEHVKDLSYSVMQWCDELYLKNNFESKFLNDDKNNIIEKKNKIIMKIRNDFIKNIIYYWDRSLMSSDAKKQGYGTHDAVILDVKFFSNNKEKKIFKTNEEFVARIHYKAKKLIRLPMFGIAIYSSDGILITGPNTTFSNNTKKVIKGEGFVYFRIKKLPLLQGKYLFSASIYDYTGRTPLDHHHQHYVFYVVNDFSKFKEKYGLLTLEHEWHYKK